MTLPAAQRIPVGLIAQMRRHARPYVQGIVLLAAYQALMYGFDQGFKYGVHATLVGEQKKGIVVGALLVLAAVVAMGIRVLSRILIFNGGRDAEYELRRVLLERLHALGPAFYRRMPSGEIMSRATNDLSQVRLLLGFAILNSFNTVFAVPSVLAVVLTISVKLTFAALAVLPLLAVVTHRFSRAMFALTRKNQAALGRMSDRAQASFAGVRVIKSFALEDAELASFQSVNREYLGHSLSLAKLRGSMGPIMQALGAASVVIVFLYGGRLLLRGEIAPAGFLTFFWSIQRLTWPVITLGFVMSMISRGLAAFTRLREIYDAEPDVVDGVLPAPERVQGGIEIRDLTFAHREGAPPVLDDVSFRIPARTTVALVGRTGAGKSTLAALLPRLLPTPRGAVFLDGTDICDLPVGAVRRAIGYAQQDAFLFSTTVARNIAMALPDPASADARATIERRARDAQILAEVAVLPDGLDTVVGERGVQLSGGQKQRVALARALAWEPRVLILDDPISAVDARTEAAILDTIGAEAERRTVLLITHRVAAARRCDTIVVLDRGRVVEQGTHDELVARRGLYARFAEEQLLEGELERFGEPPEAALSGGAP
jgi:ATP-binding cassette, subfamily B, multidrug efflux pump